MSPSAPRPVYTSPSGAVTRMVTSPKASMPRVTACTENSVRSLSTCTILLTALYTASIGPVLLLMGKVTKGVGTLSTGIGKFATAVGKAGGGWSGFLTVLGKSPAVWLAVAAAVVAGTVALADYLSGAKQAREALEGMNETAKKWKDTAAETFYGKSEACPFSA